MRVLTCQGLWCILVSLRGLLSGFLMLTGQTGQVATSLLPQLNYEPVPVRVFFGVVNFRAMHSNIITQFKSACLESIHCGFLVIPCDL